VLTIPGAEVYTALSTGLVEAADWSSPGANYRLGFHEVAPYYSRPGDYHVGGNQELIIKIDTWNELPDDLKAILLQAARSLALDGWTMTSYDDFICQGKLSAEGAEMVTWEPELTKKVKELYNDSAVRRYVKTDLGQKIYNNIQEFLTLTKP